jgi:hypothetical protein
VSSEQLSRKANLLGRAALFRELMASAKIGDNNLHRPAAIAGRHDVERLSNRRDAFTEIIRIRILRPPLVERFLGCKTRQAATELFGDKLVEGLQLG